MKNKDLQDSKLGQIIKNDLPKAPYNPWFTKTVLHRLPEKKRRIAANAEILISILAAIIILIFDIRLAIESYTAESITVRNLIVFCTYSALFGALVANVAIPLIKRRIINKMQQPQY